MGNYNTRRGYIFEKEVEEGLRLSGEFTHVYKLPDGKSLGSPIPLKVIADLIAQDLDGRIWTFECKETQATTLPARNVKDHQLDWAVGCETAYFVIHFKRYGRVFLVPGYAMKLPLSIECAERVGTELERKTARHHPQKKSAFVEW